MSFPSASYSITMRVKLTNASAIPAVATAVSAVGGLVTALDVVEPIEGHTVIDVTCNASDEGHAEVLRGAVEGVAGAHVHAVSDRTFLLHLGGTIGIEPKVPLKTRDDLSMAYTPGVARICSAIAKDVGLARKFTIKRNAVAVVTDGSAVLGLGNIGPEAALPVMEGKALLFKRFAGIDAWPVCLATQDVDEIVSIVTAIAPVYGGINLEDIAAPRCFEIERRLRDALDIPVFHDDQHGTATVVYAALLNALRVVGKNLDEVRVAIVGIGAAGVAITRLLLAEGVGDIVALNHHGILDAADPTLDDERRWVAEHTNAQERRGDLREAMRGADVFIGVSGPNVIGEEHLAVMAEDAIVFALANPDPEIDPAIARRHARVVATGRSDEPNQINNVLAFPGIFRGLLDAGATKVTEAVEIAAGRAIAAVVGEDELSADYIVPTVFNPAVVPAVAGAVEAVARSHGARHAD
ncbi:MAG TPA: NAD-dependent malic enzyme [Acidimicrobiales bacterium]|nr:NAD-dependent malic enzyme [Acidimicrobiales bacterium]